jgi:hypothetical protein
MVVEVLEAPTLRRSCRREADTAPINGTNSKELNHFQPLMQKAVALRAGREVLKPLLSHGRNLYVGLQVNFSIPYHGMALEGQQWFFSTNGLLNAHG